jgi:molybdopterin-binding protein
MPAKAQYRIGEVAELLGVSPDTVRRWTDGKRLRTRRTRGGQRVVDGAAVAEFLRRAAASRGSEPIVAQSARNTFHGIVTAVVKDRVVAQVEMRAGPHRIVSLMTREAADELGLAPGMRAVAAVKATTVIIEVPHRRGRGAKER